MPSSWTEPEPDDDLGRTTLDVVLPWTLGLLCLGQFLTWAPNYLTWPWWADHDVFGVAAQGWDRGVLPYRDLFGNNFPGTTYLFWLAGHLFGQGKTWGFYAFDAAFVAVLGLLLVVWSCRRLGRALPGLVGYALFLSYYFALDYSQAAQRDWQGPFFGVAALLVAQTWPGWRLSRIIAGLMVAAGLSIRPQVIFYVPALLIAVQERFPAEDEDDNWPRWSILSWLELGLAAGVGLALVALPLVMSGILDDFLRSLRHVGPGSPYNRLSKEQFVAQIFPQLLAVRIWLVPVLVDLLGRAGRVPKPDPAAAWLVAFACVFFYRPISPTPHAYLSHPLILTWAVMAALLASRIIELTSTPPVARLAAILLLLGMNLSVKPKFSNPNGSKEAITMLRKGDEKAPNPTGYTENLEVPSAARYPWENYRDLLAYLRTSTSPTTPIANALKHVPAINSTVPRPTVFPAESIAWLIQLRQDDEGTFADALRKSKDAVVIWAPSEVGEKGLIDLPLLTETIEELYQLDRKFGDIEVWRRKPAADAGAAPRPKVRSERIPPT